MNSAPRFVIDKFLVKAATYTAAAVYTAVAMRTLADFDTTAAVHMAVSVCTGMAAALYTAVCVRIVHDKNKKTPVDNFITMSFLTIVLQNTARDTGDLTRLWTSSFLGITRV